MMRQTKGSEVLEEEGPRLWESSPGASKALQWVEGHSID